MCVQVSCYMSCYRHFPDSAGCEGSPWKAFWKSSRQTPRKCWDAPCLRRRLMQGRQQTVQKFLCRCFHRWFLEASMRLCAKDRDGHQDRRGPMDPTATIRRPTPPNGVRRRPPLLRRSGGGSLAPMPHRLRPLRVALNPRILLGTGGGTPLFWHRVALVATRCGGLRLR